MLHTEYLKKRVKLIAYSDITPESLVEMEQHYNLAIQEAYLKGIASMYYGLALLFGPSDTMQEGLALLIVREILLQ